MAKEGRAFNCVVAKCNGAVYLRGDAKEVDAKECVTANGAVFNYKRERGRVLCAVLYGYQNARPVISADYGAAYYTVHYLFVGVVRFKVNSCLRKGVVSVGVDEPASFNEEVAGVYDANSLSGVVV